MDDTQKTWITIIAGGMVTGAMALLRFFGLSQEKVIRSEFEDLRKRMAAIESKVQPIEDLGEIRDGIRNLRGVMIPHLLTRFELMELWARDRGYRGDDPRGRSR